MWQASQTHVTEALKEGAGTAGFGRRFNLRSVLAHFVSERTREIGVRLALGASARDVVKLIGGQGLKLILPGVVIGLGAAMPLTKFMTAMLFGVGASDPLTFVGITIVLLLIALLACYLPARRATTVDPMIALRCE